MEAPRAAETTKGDAPRGEAAPIRATTSVRQRTTTDRHRGVGAWTVRSDADREQRTRREHDELSTDLVHMARRLKQNNLAIQELVQRDKKAVHAADLALATGAGRFREQHRNLQGFTAQSWATTWRLIAAALLVLVSLLAAFLLIVATRK